MSLTIDTLLKSQGEVHLTEIEIQWYFTPLNDEENSIEIKGTYNIDSFYDSHTIEIQKPKTSITGFYEIYNKVKFTDTETGSIFVLGINHITEYEISEGILTIEFMFHKSIPQLAFQIEDSIIAGVAEVSSASENLVIFQSLIDKNLRLHFEDHVFKIPRCNRCGSALSVHNNVDLEDEVINEDFVCAECYTVINNFYNLLENEIYKISDPSQMKEQRDNFVQFLMTGKKNASQIEETQLQHFYNLLIIYVEYLSGNMDTVNALQKIQAVQTIGANQDYSALQKEAENLLNRIDLKPEKSSQEAETWIPPKEGDSESIEKSIYKPEPEPNPPPIPLGTPSPAIVLPKQEETTEGLQSLDEVQAELQSTLEALSQIESDLNPNPITPTDQMHAVNMELGEVPDKIPTYDDIKETFSDLESLEFPDIKFGTDDYAEETREELIQNDESGSPSINPPPPISKQDIQIEDDQPTFSMPTVQKLPQEQNPQEEQVLPSLNPPPGGFASENEFSGSSTIETNQETVMGEEGSVYEEQDGDEYAEPRLSPPPRTQNQQLNPEWRNVSETTPPPHNTPPNQLTPPEVNPHPSSVSQNEHPPLQEIPPMNPPPVPESSTSEEVVVAFVDENDAEPIVVGNLYKGQDKVLEPEPGQKKTTKPKIHPRPSFFNSFANGNGNQKATIQPTSTKPKEAHKRISPKETRAVRKRKAKIRRIICSFCGTTLNQGKKNCPNCGSPVR